MKNILFAFIFAGIAVVTVSSCSKELDLEPVSTISDASYWKTPEQFDVFVTGLHARLRSHTLQLQYLGEMRSDIFGTDPGSSSTFTGEATQGVERLWTNNLDSDNPGVGNFGGFYTNIVQINLLIRKLEETTLVTAANKNYYLGIAHGMRAFYYFHLYRTWGKVIIQTDPITAIDISNLAKAASTEEEVMALIKADIEKSLNAFGGDFSFRQGKSFWSKAATLMLKAEVNLWNSYRGGGNNDALTAKNALTEIQANVPALTLLPSFANVFAYNSRGNNEIIFALRNAQTEAALPFSSTYYPQTGFIANFHDSAGNRQFNTTQDNWGGLLRAPVKIATFRKFDDNDSRKWHSIQPAYNKVSGNYVIAGTFVKKYEGEQVGGNRIYSNDFPVYRYADLLLLLAEAKIILGEDPSAEMNAVRARAFGGKFDINVHGYPNQPIDASPKDAILQERLFEFIFEGKRWYDLRRMGESYVFQHVSMPSVEAYRLLWPIDRNSLTNNRMLEQNPGYPRF